MQVQTFGNFFLLDPLDVPVLGSALITCRPGANR